MTTANQPSDPQRAWDPNQLSDANQPPDSQQPSNAQQLWDGGQVTPLVHCVRANNPGAMTLDGTNTWIISAPESGQALIVDPGPALVAHWGNVAKVLEQLHIPVTAGGVAGIIITHHHADHTAGIDLFHERTGAPVFAVMPEHCRVTSPVEFSKRADVPANSSSTTIQLAGYELQLLAAPGHTSDSLAVVIPELKIMFSGDTVLGRGTTVIAYPDGNLGDYLHSLSLLRESIKSNQLALILPGHGPVVANPIGVIDYYLQHRAERLQQVEHCLLGLGERPTVSEALAQRVVAQVYSDVPQQLWPAAQLSVLAQLEYLESVNQG